MRTVPAKRRAQPKQPAPKGTPQHDLVIVGRGTLGKSLAAAARQNAWRKTSPKVRLLPGRKRGRAKVPRGAKRVHWVLCVPADALESVLASLTGSLAPGDVVLHTAPTRGPEALAGVPDGVAVGVLFPTVGALQVHGSYLGSLYYGTFAFHGDARARAAAMGIVKHVHARLLRARRAPSADETAAVWGFFSAVAGLAEAAATHALAGVERPTARDRARTLRALLHTTQLLLAAPAARRAAMEKTLRRLAPDRATR